MFLPLPLARKTQQISSFRYCLFVCLFVYKLIAGFNFVQSKYTCDMLEVLLYTVGNCDDSAWPLCFIFSAYSRLKMVCLFSSAGALTSYQLHLLRPRPGRSKQQVALNRQPIHCQVKWTRLLEDALHHNWISVRSSNPIVGSIKASVH